MKTQIKFLFSFIILIAINHAVFGVIAYPYPVEIIQPDGTKITIIQKGDEYVHWAQTVDGYSIMRNKKGIYEYATKDIKNDLAPSGIKARNQSERSLSDIQFLNKTKKMLSYSKTQIGMMKDISKMKLKSAMLPSTTTGSRKLLCILMGFADKPFTKTKADFENLFNQVGYTTDGATGSVYDFYKETSFGQLDLSTTVVGPFTASHNMAFYGANRTNAPAGGGNDTIPGDLVKEAVMQADPFVNYADFDNSGNVDIYIIFAGYGEEAGAGPDAIWSHRSGITPLTLDGKLVSSYACSPELRENSGSGITHIGVICHEFGHVLGASDFYDTNYETDGSYSGTGSWDLMAGGNWNNGGTTPAHHNPYTKIYQYGWANAQTLTTAANITLANAEQNKNSFYRVNTATPNEYFLIENRQMQKFDAFIPGHGMVIYHVDKNNFSTFGGINGGSHQGMYPICADAQGNPPNDYGDIYSSGLPFPGTGNKASFTDLTTPNALSWAGANTNKSITFITEKISNKTVSFSFLENTSAPSATTVIATGITTTSAILNAKVRANNLATTVTFEYGLTTNYGSLVNGTPSAVNDTTLTSITSALTGLTANATYNYRVKAVNSLGTTYGENMTFTDNLTSGLNLPFIENFDASTLPSGWTTQNIGDGITECWSISNTRYAGGTANELYGSYYENNPGTFRIITPAINTVGISKIVLSFRQQYGISDGNLLIQSSKDKFNWTNENWSASASSFSWSGFSAINTTVRNNLNCPNTYIAFVVSGKKIDYWYIDNITMAIETSLTLPIVSTTVISDITSTTLSTGGIISSDGGDNITSRGVCWSLVSNPTIQLITKTNDGTGSGLFISKITGLSPQITYHVRAYATNSAGTAYGADIQYTKNSVVNVPTLTTTATSSITINSASSGGTISDDGGSAVTAKGICWGTSTNPTIALSTKTTDGTGIDAFISSITGLKSGNPYHVRAYATNTAGTGYGPDITFTTKLIETPIVDTAENIRQSGFTAKWTSSTSATGYRLYIATDAEFTDETYWPDDRGIYHNYIDVGDVTTFDVKGLSVNTTYYYRIRAYNTDGTSLNSNIITVTTLPDPPSAPVANTATNILQTSFTANWSIAPTATGYRLDIATDNAFTTFITGYNNKDIGNLTSFNVTGLSANTPYYLRVRAYNTGGDSPNSNVVNVTTLPNPPSAPSANTATNILQTSFTSNWSSLSTATGYRLDVATDNAFTTFISGCNNKDVGNAASYLITGLSANTSYYYRVRAYNTGGASPNSGTITATTLPNPPAAPTANPATSIVQTSLTANWSTSATATGYRLDVATNVGFTVFVAGFNDKDVSNVTSYSVTGLIQNTTYYYRVRAFNTGGTSPNSGVITTTLPNPPATPTANPATNIVQMSLTANWNTSAIATGYRLDVATNLGFTAFVAGFNDKDVSNVTSYSVTGLIQNTTYYYRLRAYNTGGASPNSSIITVTTLPNPPAAPTTKPTTNLLQTGFTANWNTSATATGYRLDIATNSGFTAFVVGFNDKDVSNVTTISVTGLSARTQYYFRVRGYNTGGIGTNSISLPVTTLTNPPAAPIGLTASSCNNLVTLKWRKNSDPYFIRYRIYGGLTNNPTTKMDSTSDAISDTTRILSGLTNGQTYYFRVTAVNYDGPESPFSNQSSAIVKTGVMPKIKAKFGDLLICSNLGDSIASYQWFKSSSMITNAIGQYYTTNKQLGTYNVETIDKNGCKNVSNTISILSLKSLTLYPNPASVSFALKFNGGSEVNDVSNEIAIVSIINSTGAKVMEFQAKNMHDEQLKAIPVSNLANGVYVVQVLINQKDLYYTKIVVLK